MSDRLDIDALLIGSLYGELSSTEEARLQAHLESHPADRTALADLTRARTAVRESRIFEIQAEPPQSISALLMQEAARRAPKKVEEKERWFQRFLASLRSPAFAAAAMLVVVVGVAGTMYMKKGDQFAEQTKSTAPDRATEPTADRPAPAMGAAAGSAAFAQEEQDKQEIEGAADNFQVSLEEAPKQDSDGTLDRGGRVAAKDSKKQSEKVRGLEVNTPSQRMPKDVADERFSAPPPKSPPAPGMVASESKGAPAPAAKPVAPQPSPTTTTAVGGASGGATTGAKEADAKDSKTKTATRAPAQNTVEQKPAEDKSKADSAETSWARAQHVRVVDRVRAGNCRDAANIALQISNRAPGYYQQNVENDRDLKQCISVINRERELDAERAQKARNKRAEEPRPADAAAPSK